VSERDPVCVRRKRAGNDCVGVALDDDGRRAERGEQFIQGGRSVADLSTAGLAADTNVRVRWSHAELGEEDIGQVGVVVLARMDDVCVVTE